MSNGHNDHDRRHADSRGVRRVGAAAIATLVAGLLLVPAPGSADPTGPTNPSGAHAAPSLSQARARLDTLNHQAEVASEAYNTVRVHMQQAQARLVGLRSDLHRQELRVGALRSQIVGAALSDYASSGGLSTSASFLVAKSPTQFIDALASTAIVQHRQVDLLTAFRQQQNLLGFQAKQADRELAAIKGDRAQLAKHRAAVEGKLADAEHLLSQLKEKARQRVIALQQSAATTASTPSPSTPSPSTPSPSTSPTPSRGVDRPPTYSSPPASGRAAVAVSTALAQLGKPYVWGTAGPNTFDCSGLTMYAWAAAGVALSHASSVQSQQGVPVTISDLRPGDLVFYYSPVSHVAMYIGNGQVVHAPHTGSVVQIVPLTSMPIAWARRVG